MGALIIKPTYGASRKERENQEEESWRKQGRAAAQQRGKKAQGAAGTPSSQ